MSDECPVWNSYVDKMEGRRPGRDYVEPEEWSGVTWIEEPEGFPQAQAKEKSAFLHKELDEAFWFYNGYWCYAKTRTIYSFELQTKGKL